MLDLEIVRHFDGDMPVENTAHIFSLKVFI